MSVSHSVVGRDTSLGNHTKTQRRPSLRSELHDSKILSKTSTSECDDQNQTIVTVNRAKLALGSRNVNRLGEKFP